VVTSATIVITTHASLFTLSPHLGPQRHCPTLSCGHHSFIKRLTTIVRHTLALELTLHNLAKSSTMLLAKLQSLSVPSVHIISDEARVAKRAVLQVIVCVGHLLIYCPIQDVPDSGYNRNVTDKQKLAAVSAAASSAPTSKVRSLGWHAKKVPTVCLYGALCNSLRQHFGFTFSLARSPAPLGPVKKHELRLAADNGRHYVLNEATGLEAGIVVCPSLPSALPAAAC
jgi:hypothetical protein